MLKSLIAGTSEHELEMADDITSESGTERRECIHVHVLACFHAAQFLDFDSPYQEMVLPIGQLPLQVHVSSCHVFGV